MAKIYFIAAEVSGDFIGGRVINHLKNDKELTFAGVGGKYIEEAGNFKSLFPISEISLMGFLEIIPKIFKLRKLINDTVQDVIKNKPDLLITIDSPGFTYRVAKQLKKLLPDLKMMHIVAPSVWAYKENRAVKYAKIYDYLLALLPFEPPYFTKVGLDCRYIGHPVMEQEFYSDKSALRNEFNIDNDRPLSKLADDREFVGDTQHSTAAYTLVREDTNSGSLPQLPAEVEFPKRSNTKILCVTLGSRRGEILRHLPIFLATIEELYNSLLGDKESRIESTTIGNTVSDDIVKSKDDFKSCNTKINLEKNEKSVSREAERIIVREHQRTYKDDEANLKGASNRVKSVVFNYKARGAKPIIIGEMTNNIVSECKSFDYIVIFTLANPDHEELIKPFLVNVKFDYLFSCERLKSYAVADLALAKSGTNTLEIAASGTPMVVAYKVNIFSYFIIKALIKIKYVTLINIIAGREIIPEFIQFNCKASLINLKLKELLLDPEKAYNQVIENNKVLNQLGFKSNESPSYNAAKIIKEVLK